MNNEPTNPSSPAEVNPAPERRRFHFFPPRQKDPLFEGRYHNEYIKQDVLENRFPTKWQVCLFAGLVSIALYLLTMSWVPFPGRPTSFLLRHLRAEPISANLNLIWGWGVRIVDRLPGESLAVWMGLFSAVCGALSVLLMARLLLRVGYVVRNEPASASSFREAYARRLSSITGSLFLAFCVPFWVSSTRTLPATFHTLMLLFAAWRFSEYQHWGRKRELMLLGLVFGFGMTEAATFVVFFPILFVLLIREMFRWHALKSWRCHVSFWFCLILGFSWHIANAFVLYSRGRYMEIFSSPWQALWTIWTEQAQMIAAVRFSPAFFVIMFFAFVPWATVFLMSRRSPWFYEWGQILVRAIYLIGLLGVLYNAKYAPWRLMGMEQLMITPYLFMAGTFGYMVGEFWILGERQVMLDVLRRQRFMRWVYAVFALLIPVLTLGSFAANWRITTGANSRLVNDTARNIVDNRDGRWIIISSGLLDEHLRLMAWERRLPIVVVSAPRLNSPIYVRSLAGYFKEPELRMALQYGNFGRFLDTLMIGGHGMDSVGVVDMPDVFREFGNLLPHGLLYLLKSDLSDVDWREELVKQMDFWAWMDELNTWSISEENILFLYRQALNQQAAQAANNLGVLLQEHGENEMALSAYRAARRFAPKNLSMILNMLYISFQMDVPEMDQLFDDLDDAVFQAGNIRWGLSRYFGYVWDSREWVRRGYVWALSGDVREDVLAVRSEESTAVAQMVEQLFLQWGMPFLSEMYYRNLLMSRTYDTDALLALCGMALRKNEPEMAAAYIAEAMAMGRREEDVYFEQAVTAYLRGDKDTALDLARDITRTTPSDVRAWVAVVMWTEAGSLENEQAIRTIQTHRLYDVPARLALAQVFMDRKDWERAKMELESAVQLESMNVFAWEMLGSVANEMRDGRLMAASLRALQLRDANHYLKFQQQGLDAYQEGDLAAAEDAFRKGIHQKRDARLLNNLAHVIMERNGNLTEALALINESIKRSYERELGMFSTRAEIQFRRGFHPDALTDLDTIAAKQPLTASQLLLKAEIQLDLEDWAALAETLRVFMREHPVPDDALAARVDRLREELKRRRSASAQ